MESPVPHIRRRLAKVFRWDYSYTHPFKVRQSEEEDYEKVAKTLRPEECGEELAARGLVEFRYHDAKRQIKKKYNYQLEEKNWPHVSRREKAFIVEECDDDIPELTEDVVSMLKYQRQSDAADNYGDPPSALQCPLYMEEEGDRSHFPIFPRSPAFEPAAVRAIRHENQRIVDRLAEASATLSNIEIALTEDDLPTETKGQLLKLKDTLLKEWQPFTKPPEFQLVVEDEPLSAEHEDFAYERTVREPIPQPTALIENFSGVRKPIIHVDHVEFDHYEPKIRKETDYTLKPWEYYDVLTVLHQNASKDADISYLVAATSYKPVAYVDTRYLSPDYCFGTSNTRPPLQKHIPRNVMGFYGQPPLVKERPVIPYQENTQQYERLLWAQVFELPRYKSRQLPIIPYSEIHSSTPSSKDGFCCCPDITRFYLQRYKKDGLYPPDHIVCPICLDFLINPIYLPCNCIACLECVVSGRRLPSPLPPPKYPLIRCPRCNYSYVKHKQDQLEGQLAPPPGKKPPVTPVEGLRMASEKKAALVAKGKWRIRDSVVHNITRFRSNIPVSEPKLAQPSAPWMLAYHLRDLCVDELTLRKMERDRQLYTCRLRKDLSKMENKRMMLEWGGQNQLDKEVNLQYHSLKRKRRLRKISIKFKNLCQKEKKIEKKPEKEHASPPPSEHESLEAGAPYIAGLTPRNPIPKTPRMSLDIPNTKRADDPYYTPSQATDRSHIPSDRSHIPSDRSHIPSDRSHIPSLSKGRTDLTDRDQPPSPRNSHDESRAHSFDDSRQDRDDRSHTQGNKTPRLSPAPSLIQVKASTVLPGVRSIRIPPPSPQTLSPPQKVEPAEDLKNFLALSGARPPSPTLVPEASPVAKADAKSPDLLPITGPQVDPKSSEPSPSFFGRRELQSPSSFNDNGAAATPASPTEAKSVQLMTAGAIPTVPAVSKDSCQTQTAVGSKLVDGPEQTAPESMQADQQPSCPVAKELSAAHDAKLDS